MLACTWAVAGIWGDAKILPHRAGMGDEVDFMFPTDCKGDKGFYMEVACNEASAYRPKRIAY